MTKWQYIAKLKERYEKSKASNDPGYASIGVIITELEHMDEVWVKPEVLNERRKGV